MNACTNNLNGRGRQYFRNQTRCLYWPIWGFPVALGDFCRATDVTLDVNRSNQRKIAKRHHWVFINKLHRVNRRRQNFVCQIMTTGLSSISCWENKVAMQTTGGVWSNLFSYRLKDKLSDDAPAILSIRRMAEYVLSKIARRNNAARADPHWGNVKEGLIAHFLSKRNCCTKETPSLPKDSPHREKIPIGPTDV